MKITRRTEQEINISELKAAIKEGRGLEVIRPHDEITLALDTGETITPVCGYVGKHSARFVFKDCLREMWQMNKTMTNNGMTAKMTAPMQISFSKKFEYLFFIKSPTKDLYK